VVLSGGGVALTQDKVEDAAVRSALNLGNANRLIVDPIALSAYNKITFGKERIVLAGSPQNATGGDLRTQWVSGGSVNIEASQFLRGKAKPARARQYNGPSAPTISLAQAAGGALPAGDRIYFATSFNEVGESALSPAVAAITVVLNNKVTVTITHPGSGTTPRGFNVYSTLAGGTAASAKFIGRVILTAGAGSTDFVDLGNKVPGFVTGYLIQGDTMEIRELSPYSRLKLAVTSLAIPEAHFRFCTLAVTKPRMNVLIDNIKGTI
jgi:hypothetical protein